jgi:serine/threonine protein kinase/WD40 repeat protein
VKELGKGGMGAVYLAVDTRLDRKLALKVMLPEFASNKDAKERFIREAKAVAKIAHDNVVTIFEADEREGVPYIAMQFLQGAPLDDFLREKGSPALAHCVRIGIEAARGLAAAHELGLVHRDIKPANLWLEAPNGRVKVLDFGLAKPVGSDSELTKSGAVVGTPAYMSPEQARGVKVDARTDVFSLGTVMYRLLAGKNPFAGENIMAVLMALGMEEPTPIRELNPNVPEPLASFVMRMLSKQPDARPQTALEVAQGLRAALAQPSAPTADVSTSMPVVVSVQPVPQSMQLTIAPESAFANLTDDENDATQAESEPVAAESPAPRTRSKVPLIAGGLVALVAAVGVAIALGTGGKKPDDTAKNVDPPPVPQPKEKEKDKPKPGAWVPSPEWKPVPVGASPFDKLDANEIPKDERFAWQPPELVAIIGSHKGRMWGGGAACFSPDGKLVAAGMKPVIWDFETQTPKWEVKLPANVWANPFAFSPDGNRLYLSEHAGVLAFDLTADGPKPHKTKPDGAPEYFVKFEGPGTWALAEGGKTLVRVLWRHDKPQKAACYDLSGAEPRETSSLMAHELHCAADANQVVYRAPDGKVMRAAIKNGAFGPGEELAIGADEKACMFNLSPDGTRLGVRTVWGPSGGTDIWDVSQVPPKKLHALAPTECGGWSSYGFSRDGRWLASTYTFTDLLRLTDAKPKVTRIDATGLSGDNSAVFSADGTRAVSVSDRGFVRFFDLKGPEPKELSPLDHSTAFRAPHFQDRFLDSPKGRLTLPRYDGQSQVWALAGAQPVPFPNANALFPFWQARPVARDRWVAGGIGTPCQLFALGEKGAELLSEAAPASDNAHVSPDGTMLVRTLSNPLRLEAHDLSGATPVAKWVLESKEHSPPSDPNHRQVHVSADNRWLAYTTDPNTLALALWRTSGAKPEFYARIPVSHWGQSYRAAFSPDGKLLAHPSADTGSIVIEDLTGRAPREVNRLTGGPPRPNDWNLEHGWLAFHPDGKKLVAASRHIGVRVVDALAGTVLWQWDPPAGAGIHWAEWAHDGRHLFVHLSNNTIYVLRLSDLSGAKAGADRKAAEWVIGAGGSVKVNGEARAIGKLADLPTEVRSLEWVMLFSRQAKDEGMALLGECKSLKFAALNRSGVTDAGLAHLARCPALEDIGLEGAPITDVGLSKFKDHPALKSLFLVNTGFGNASLEALKGCPKLERICLGQTPVTDAGLAHLKDYKALNDFYMWAERVTDVGIARAAECKTLTMFGFGGMPLTDSALEHVAKMDKLVDFNSTQTKATKAGIEKLARALPKCKIKWDGGVIEPSANITFPPLDPKWVEQVRALKFDEQAKEVADELKRRNPEFDPADVVLEQAGRTVRLTSPAVADLTPLRALPKLAEVYVKLPQAKRGEARLANLGPLAGLPLRNLTIENCPRVTDLAPLRGAPLKYLHIAGLGVTDLGPLADAPLTSVGLIATPVKSLEPLASKPLTIFLAHEQGLVGGGFNDIDYRVLKGMPVRELGVDPKACSPDEWAVLRTLPVKTLYVGTHYDATRDPERLREFLKAVPTVTKFESAVLNAPGRAGARKSMADVLRAFPNVVTINGKPAAEFWKEFDAAEKK